MEANPKAPNDSERAAGFTWSLADQREHRSYVIASILSSVAFLEGSINELYSSAGDPNIELGGTLAEAERSRLADVAEFVERDRLLESFSLLCTCLDGSLSTGGKSYQNAATLVKLRNELVHYKPRYRSGEDQFKDTDKWLQALQEKRFKLNPFTGSANPFFPDRCLSHGCAVWVWKTVLAFADGFFARLGVDPVYNDLRGILNP